VDPWQAHRSIITLQVTGLSIREFPQTLVNTTRIGQVLFDLLNGGKLQLYPAADLCQQALSTVGVETALGTKISKDKQSKKIDVMLPWRWPALQPWTMGRLAMAVCLSALSWRQSTIQRRWLALLGLPMARFDLCDSPHLTTVATKSARLRKHC
jgi:hypothetical protein